MNCQYLVNGDYKCNGVEPRNVGWSGNVKAINMCLKINKNTWETLEKHFNIGDMKFVLVGITETLKTDIGNDLSKRLVHEDGKIIHYDTDSDNFNGLPLKVQEAVKAVNDLKLYGYVNKKLGNVRHVIATVTQDDTDYLKNANFGIVVNICGYNITGYASNAWTSFTQFFYIDPSLKCMDHGIFVKCNEPDMYNP